MQSGAVGLNYCERGQLRTGSGNFGHFSILHFSSRVHYFSIKTANQLYEFLTQMDWQLLRNRGWEKLSEVAPLSEVHRYCVKSDIFSRYVPQWQIHIAVYSIKCWIVSRVEYFLEINFCGLLRWKSTFASINLREREKFYWILLLLSPTSSDVLSNVLRTGLAGVKFYKGLKIGDICFNLENFRTIK